MKCTERIVVAVAIAALAAAGYWNLRVRTAEGDLQAAADDTARLERVTDEARRQERQMEAGIDASTAQADRDAAAAAEAAIPTIVKDARPRAMAAKSRLAEFAFSAHLTPNQLDQLAGVFAERIDQVQIKAIQDEQKKAQASATWDPSQAVAFKARLDEAARMINPNKIKSIIGEDGYRSLVDSIPNADMASLVELRFQPHFSAAGAALTNEQHDQLATLLARSAAELEIINIDPFRGQTFPIENAVRLEISQKPVNVPPSVLDQAASFLSPAQQQVFRQMVFANNVVAVDTARSTAQAAGALAAARARGASPAEAAAEFTRARYMALGASADQVDALLAAQKTAAQ